MSISVRPDLRDIEDTIVHLYELQKYFQDKHREFDRRWTRAPSDFHAMFPRSIPLKPVHT